MSRSQFLTKLRRRSCECIEKESSVVFVTDALIASIQSLPLFHGKEIVDIDIGLKDPVPMKIYLRKVTKRSGP